MKRCSQCGQIYENSFNFCETDGFALFSVGEIDVHPKPGVTNEGSANRGALTTGLIGAIAGIVLCLAVFTVYSFLQVQVDPHPTEVPTYTSQRQPPAHQTRSESARATNADETPTESTEAEPVEEESPEPSPAETQEAQEANVRLNQGPVSTGQRSASQAGTQTVIEMTDGSSLVVDAAWQDSEGVWYRRGGLVSYIESGRVKSITARAEPKNSPN